MGKLTHTLINKGYLKSDRIIQAFSEIQRHVFVQDRFERDSEADIPLPVGYGQVLSQPSISASLLELLQVQSGDNVLHVGCNVGWVTALLCFLVQPKGHVTALEIIPELAEVARYNLEKYSFIKRNKLVEFHTMNGEVGYPDNAPYDKILVHAAVEKDIPLALFDQLKVGGKMVIPVRDEVWYVDKISHDEKKIETYQGFDFAQFIRN